MTPIDPKQIEILDAKQVAYWRSQTPAQKFEKLFYANRQVRSVLKYLIKEAHADWDEGQIAADVACRILRGSDWIHNNADLLA